MYLYTETPVEATSPGPRKGRKLPVSCTNSPKLLVTVKWYFELFCAIVWHLDLNCKSPKRFCL